MIRFKKISEMQGMKVFVENGDYFGEVEDALITLRKVSAWKVRSARNSILEKVFTSNGNAGGKGVIVPHGLVKAIGDVVLISRSAIPNYPEEPADVKA